MHEMRSFPLESKTLEKSPNSLRQCLFILSIAIGNSIVPASLMASSGTSNQRSNRTIKRDAIKSDKRKNQSIPSKFFYGGWTSLAVDLVKKKEIEEPAAEEAAALAEEEGREETPDLVLNDDGESLEAIFGAYLGYQITKKSNLVAGGTFGTKSKIGDPRIGISWEDELKEGVTVGSFSTFSVPISETSKVDGLVTRLDVQVFFEIESGESAYELRPILSLSKFNAPAEEQNPPPEESPEASTEGLEFEYRHNINEKLKLASGVGVERISPREGDAIYEMELTAIKGIWYINKKIDLNARLRFIHEGVELPKGDDAAIVLAMDYYP